MKNEKIQTGLRIPAKRYDELSTIAARSGISLNSLILYLVDVGLSAVNRGVEEEARFEPHSQLHSVEEPAQ